MLFVGESHTDIAFHRVQLQVIRGAAQARARGAHRPRDVPLHRAGVARPVERGQRSSEDELRREVALVQELGLPLALLPRHLPVRARRTASRCTRVNTPREVVSAVRKKGLQNLTPEEAARIPPKVDTEQRGPQDALPARSSPARRA
ncbi:MAG: ChaN family lipoprotein [Ignavibacteriales bacterium]|nr:ChaN family lipoprotein [Ignavibacteriales bacterium]